MFKQFDVNADGILNEQEFRSLLISMEILRDQNEIEQILHQIDPYNNQLMTYSDVVSILSQHMVPRIDKS